MFANSWINICLFCFLKFMVTSVAAVSYIPVNNDGSVLDQSNIPKCKENGRIKLESYHYFKKECPPGGICLRKKEQLSSLAVYHLFQSCSARDTCINLRFPASDIQTGGYTEVSIQHQCVEADSVLDMCENNTSIFNNSHDQVQLAIPSDTTAYHECTCDINGFGTFRLHDVRLKARKKEMCSPAALQIKFNKYSCNASSEEYGSILNQTLQIIGTRVNVLYAAHSKDVQPEMVWIILNPIDVMTVSCLSVRKTPETTTPDIVATAQQINYTGGDLTSVPQDVATNTAGLPLGLVVVTVSIPAAGLILLGIYRWRKRKQQRREQVTLRSENRNEEEKIPEENSPEFNFIGCSCLKENTELEQNIYVQIDNGRLDGNARDTEEEPYDDTALSHENVTVQSQTTDSRMDRSSCDADAELYNTALLHKNATVQSQSTNSGRDRISCGTNEEPYNTALLHKNVAVLSPTYNHLKEIEESRAKKVYSLAKDLSEL